MFFEGFRGLLKFLTINLGFLGLLTFNLGGFGENFFWGFLGFLGVFDDKLKKIVDNYENVDDYGQPLIEKKVLTIREMLTIRVLTIMVKDCSHF